MANTVRCFHSRSLGLDILARRRHHGNCSAFRSLELGPNHRPLQAALSGSLIKAPGFAGGYLLDLRPYRARTAEQGPAVGRRRGIVSEVVSKIGSVRSRCVEGVGRPWIDFHGRPGPAYASGRGSWRSWSTRSFTEPSVRPDFERSATRNPQRNAVNLRTPAVAPCRQGVRRGTSPTRSSRKSG